VHDPLPPLPLLPFDTHPVDASGGGDEVHEQALAVLTRQLMRADAVLSAL
jgi:hypothetical protein